MLITFFDDQRLHDDRKTHYEKGKTYDLPDEEVVQWLAMQRGYEAAPSTEVSQPTYHADNVAAEHTDADASISTVAPINAVAIEPPPASPVPAPFESAAITQTPVSAHSDVEESHSA